MTENGKTETPTLQTEITHTILNEIRLGEPNIASKPGERIAQCHEQGGPFP